MRLRVSEEVKQPDQSVVIFLVDGMDLTRFEDMLKAGDLPNIQRVFVDGGVRVRGAVTSLPSVTYPNCTSVITGVYPGHHGIMGNFWLDRSSLQMHYYMTFGTYRDSNKDFSSPTLFEILSDRFTVSIQAHTRRGATEILDNRANFGISWLLHQFIYADTYVGLRFKDVAKIASKSHQWPSVILTYYPGVDEIGHRNASNSCEYGKAVRDIDHTVGLVTQQMEQLGLSDSTYYVLVTDHSHVPIGPGHSVDVSEWLRHNRQLNIRTKMIVRGDFANRLAQLEPYEVIGGLDGDRVVRFYLRGERGWTCVPSADEISRFIQCNPPLTQIPGVGIVLMKDGPDRVHVFSRDGEARVKRRRSPGGLRYQLVNLRGDPLNYRASPELATFIEAGWHASRDWLRATVSTTYPDFVAQAVEVFDTPHTGEIVLFADGDWSFDTKQVGGHGSSLGYDMRIPLFFAGVDLPRGAEIGPARIVDVTPTIVGLLGEGERLKDYELDGIDLSDEIRRAAPIQVR